MLSVEEGNFNPNSQRLVNQIISRCFTSFAVSGALSGICFLVETAPTEPDPMFNIYIYTKMLLFILLVQPYHGWFNLTDGHMTNSSKLHEVPYATGPKLFEIKSCCTKNDAQWRSMPYIVLHPAGCPTLALKEWVCCECEETIYNWITRKQHVANFKCCNLSMQCRT